MSSLLQNRGWLCVQFRLDNKNIRLYLGLRDTRQNCRSPLIKEVFESVNHEYGWYGELRQACSGRI